MKKYKKVSNSLDKGKIFISFFIVFNQDDKNILEFFHCSSFNRFVWCRIIGIESDTI